MTAPAHNRVPIDPNAAIPDLVRSLADDSKRLLKDEIQLAKLESQESLKKTSKGVMWLALAFGVSVVMLVAATLMLVTLVGEIANDNFWVGALVTGLVELALAAWLIRKGIGAFRTDAYSLPETRAAAKEVAQWARHPRQA